MDIQVGTPEQDFKLTMPFGKYKGCRIVGIPAGYLKWVLEHVDIKNEGLKSGITNELAAREELGDSF